MLDARLIGRSTLHDRIIIAVAIILLSSRYNTVVVAILYCCRRDIFLNCVVGLLLRTPVTCLFVYISFWAGVFLFTAKISDIRAWSVDGLDVSPSFRIILSYGDGVA